MIDRVSLRGGTINNNSSDDGQEQIKISGPSSVRKRFSLALDNDLWAQFFFLFLFFLLPFSFPTFRIRVCWTESGADGCAVYGYTIRED
jgi:hypothetical protein